MTENELLENIAWVQRLARGLLRDPCMAEDVAQDVLAVALERQGEALQPGRMRAWLASVTRNLAFQALRREGHRSSVEASAARAEAIQDSTERAELQHSLATAVLGLDEIYRTVLTMRFFDDLAPREIARRLGLPGATVRKRLSRAVAQVHASVRRQPDFEQERWLARLALSARLEPSPAGASGTPLAPWIWASVVVGSVALAAFWIRTDAAPASSARVSSTPGSAQREALDGGPIPIRLVGLEGLPVNDVPIYRATDSGFESLGLTDEDGVFELEGPRRDVFVASRAAPPRRVDLSGVPAGGVAGEEGAGHREPHLLQLDVGRTFIGAVFVGQELTTEPLTFRLHVDAMGAGAGEIPRELLDSELVELTPEGDYVLEAVTGNRGAFFFWGIPPDTEVMLTPPPGMRIEFHPFGELLPGGGALELFPPVDVGLFRIAPIEDESESREPDRVWDS